VEYRLAGGLRKASSMYSLDSSIKCRRYETFSVDLVGGNSSISFLLTASGERRKEILSCVARAEPRNKLCGITVAPKIPTARGTWC